ncbi:MAG: acyl carrier protein [Lachnospiraceae bacterium]|jgi:acyl carrier protein|nr:acyl carrier protein [Lachnospiraceae bacterium]MCI1726999.1 acyl carrier protein [Lachnospiraceae bacterium]
MLERVIDILADHTDFPKEQITADTDLVSDLELNSFEVFSMVSEMEDEFGIEVQDEDIMKFQKVQDIVDYIEAHQ